MLLFLDFDGVLHPMSGGTFNLSCMGHLEETLANYPQVEIVISSSWREQYTIDQLKQLLGENLGQRVVGQTPVIDDPFLKHVRYYEVLKYLKDSCQKNHPWVALDDTPGFYPDNAPVIWCNGHTGMTEREGALLHTVLQVLKYQNLSKTNEWHKLVPYHEEELLEGMTPEKAHADELEK